MRITLGVTGGVAAYKAAELVRRLQQDSFSVQVVMTRAAREFITPLTFAALTGQKVITDLFSESGGHANLESAIEHIAVAQRTDLLLVAPATADALANFAHGIADDFLSTLYLASTAPVVLAPAMNVNMWNHPATQENVATLRSRGVHIVDPDEGYLACGMTGAGRLAGQDAIVAAVHEALKTHRDLQGEIVLVTAGPTCEDLDPVRYLTNRSSGKMGYALAEAAVRRGARVILVSGPTSLKPPAAVEFVPVQTARQMRDAVIAALDPATIVIKTAAVADFTPRQAAEQKIKRKGSITLDLEPTPDILAEVGARKGPRIVIGFAAETQDTLENARKKLESKSLDAIVVNDVSQPGIGFDSDRNAVTIITRSGTRSVPETSKWEVAHRVLDEVVKISAERAKQTESSPR